MAKWTEEEASKLKEIYSSHTSSEIESILNRKRKSFRRKAEELGLSKDKETRYKIYSLTTKKKWSDGRFDKEKMRANLLRVIKNRDQTGSKNPNWKGKNRKDILRRDREDERYKTWRTNVFSRDKYTCGLCLKIGGSIEAHHIKLFSIEKELRYKESNGITLCRKCHKSIRKKESQFEQRFTNYINTFNTYV